MKADSRKKAPLPDAVTVCEPDSGAGGRGMPHGILPARNPLSACGGAGLFCV
jgi:hypothetical protein